MPVIKQITDAEYQQEVLNAEVLTIVDFWAPWCAPCLAIAPDLEKIQDEFGDRLKVVKLNVDENPAHAQENGITGIPTLLFYKGGELVDRLTGANSPAVMKERINQHI